MKKSKANATTAKNLEDKFDQGENVLDYFDVSKARVVDPRSKKSVPSKFRYRVKRVSKSAAVARERSAHYSKKK
jgi:hypothetical protein